MANRICKSLRTKKSYIPALQDADFLREQDPYLQYFCVKTLHAVGPDDDMVFPGSCGIERTCFQALVKPALA